MHKKEWMQRLKRCLFGAGAALGCEIALLMLCAALILWEVVGEEGGQKCVWTVTALCSFLAANYSASAEKKPYLQALGSGMLLVLLLTMGKLMGGAIAPDRVRETIAPIVLGCIGSMLVGRGKGQRKGEHKKTGRKKRRTRKSAH